MLVVTGDPGREGAAWDVLVVIFHQDAVVSRQDGKVGHGAGPVLVVHTADVRLGWTLDGQRETTYKSMAQTRLYFLLVSSTLPGLSHYFAL